jgi:hypothetical protein
MTSTPSAVNDVNHVNEVNHVKKTDTAARRSIKRAYARWWWGGWFFDVIDVIDSNDIGQH